MTAPRMGERIAVALATAVVTSLIMVVLLNSLWPPRPDAAVSSTSATRGAPPGDVWVWTPADGITCVAWREPDEWSSALSCVREGNQR